MFKVFIRSAWRSLLKNKVNSFINITGLAIGLGCSLLICLYVFDELSYDQFFPDKERIYQVNTFFSFGGNEMHMAQSSDVMGPTLKKDYPEVENYTRIYTNSGPKLIRKGASYFNESQVAHVDSTFFDVFKLPVIRGNLKHALTRPGTVVLTASAAMKYFSSTDVIGKSLLVKQGSGQKPYEVTAVIKDMPLNSHFHFDFFFDMQSVQYNWGAATSHNFYTYLKLSKGVDYKEFEKVFPAYVEKYVLPDAAKYIDVKSMAEFEKAGNELTYSLIPLIDIHLHSSVSSTLSAAGSLQYVYIFSAVAVFILLMACINFINLTTARSGSRAREVGIKKVFGTSKKQLVNQFLTESILLAIIAMLIALIMVAIAIPGFNQLSDKDLNFASLFKKPFVYIIILLPFVVGGLAGIYPAFFLSSFKPVEVLKGELNIGGGKSRFRNALVVFQFSISIILIIATMIVYRQLDFIHHKNIGFKKDHVLIINETGPLASQFTAFKQELLQWPEIINVSFSGFLPVSKSFRGDNTYSTAPVMTTQNGFSMQNWDVDEDYIKTLGMSLVKGRGFSRDFLSDSSAVVINEAAAKLMGSQDPVGKFLYGTDLNGGVQKYHVIGVVADFNFESMHSQVGPLGLFLKPSPFKAVLKIKTGDLQGLTSRIHSLWEKFAPGMPFNYQFLDDRFNEMYKAEARTGTTAILFSVLAIFIACLGLFGLAMFAVERRIKEIGIRKVLGSSNTGIVSLLSKEFIQLVLLSFIIAAPIAWYCMHRWLEGFAFKVDIEWWVFVIAGITAVLIALITVSVQAIKAAISNPVVVLKAQ